MDGLHMRRILLVLPLIGLLLFLVPTTGSVQQPIQGNTLSLTFAKQTHQALGGGCYNAQIYVTITSTFNGTMTIPMSQFFLYSTGNNLTVTNSTNYKNPSNSFGTLFLFP